MNADFYVFAGILIFIRYIRKQKNFSKIDLLPCKCKKSVPTWGAMSEYKKKMKPYRCLNCGREGVGRSDRKFCSVECKNAWHNTMGRSSRLCRSRIITALGRNYEILRESMERGELSIDLMTLEDRGFRPCYVTGYNPVRYGPDTFRCFDITYCRSASRVYRIRKEKED